MSKTATFIAKKARIVPEKILRNPDGTPNIVPAQVAYDAYSRAELVALVKAGDESAFFAVPESHAEQNIRRNHTYQEVDLDGLKKTAFPGRAKTNGLGK